MFKLIRFLKYLLGIYLPTVGGIWAFVEAYTYFKGESLKQLLGSYWWLIYVVPLLPTLIIAFLKSFNVKNEFGNVPAVDIAEGIWNSKIRPRLSFQGQVSIYLKHLESKIREMPFIYKGLEGHVKNDFVDVEIKSLDYLTLESKPVFSGVISNNQKLRDSKKIIILGGGGIGKTTFQRYTILEIISNPKPSILHSKEKVIPIYIPLKVIDNSSSFPILRYILQNTSFLANNKDIDTLIKLASAGKILLFLDGYDEIQFAGASSAGRNFVREELNFMFSLTGANKQSFVNADEKYIKFYESLTNCRIWFSSRKEFFMQHPITIDRMDFYSSSKTWAIELKGIGDNRVKLIEIIFDKYRKKSGDYARFFNAEYFIQEIDESPESEVHKLSFNPLFLTIMCYIYAQKVIKHNRFDVKWGNSFNELIIECVNLLLRDLDEAKARDLHEAQKTALLRRRNSYQEEKEEFLLYFSKELFHDEQNIFNFTYIKDKIRFFFINEYKSIHAEKIIMDLASDLNQEPNFAEQLIFAGIFIIVDKSNKEIWYDFPHRRFREVLATKYYIKYGHAALLENLKRESFSELIYVFFSVSNYQDEILELVLRNTKNEVGNNYSSNLAINSLNKKPTTYNPNKVLSDFFMECILKDERFCLSESIFEYFKPNPDFMDTLSGKYIEFLNENKIFSFSLSFDLLYRYNNSLLRALSKANLAARLKDKDNLALLNFFKHPNIIEWFKEDSSLTEYLKFLNKMYDLFMPIFNKNDKIPIADKNRPEYCYIVTEKVLADLKRYVREKTGYNLDTNILTPLENMQYDVNFSPDNLLKAATRLNKNSQMYLLEESKLNYISYHEAMILIGKLKKPLQEISFFIP